MDNHTLTPVQAALLEIFKDFRAFCEQNNLQYYSCSGTTIGAVRHKGFIPWDDDIDVYMCLEDYKRFLELKETLKGGKYEIIDYRDENYYLPGFSKFSKVSSSIWEEECYPFMMGVYIDVFPLYEVPDRETFMSIKKPMEYYNDVYARSILRYNASCVWSDIKRFSVVELLRKGMNVFYHRPRKKYYLKKLIELQQKAARIKGNYLVNYTLNPKSDMLEKSWFEKYLEVPFEDQSIRLPVGYLPYLETRFGDFMTPPPVEQRVTHHKRFFEDLNVRYTLEQARKLAKQRTH